MVYVLMRLKLIPAKYEIDYLFGAGQFIYFGASNLGFDHLLFTRDDVTGQNSLKLYETRYTKEFSEIADGHQIIHQKIEIIKALMTQEVAVSLGLSNVEWILTYVACREHTQ